MSLNEAWEEHLHGIDGRRWETMEDDGWDGWDWWDGWGGCSALDFEA